MPYVITQSYLPPGRGSISRRYPGRNRPCSIYPPVTDERLSIPEPVAAVDVQAAVSKLQEMTTKAQENAGGKMSESDLQSMHGRADVVTYAVLAEVQHFEQYRISNFRDYVTRYLQGQIEFYKTASRSID